MAKKTRKKKAASRSARRAVRDTETPAATTTMPAELQEFLAQPAAPKGFVNRNPLSAEDLRRRLIDKSVRPTVSPDRLAAAINRIKPRAAVPEERLPEEIRSTVRALKPELRRFHGVKIALSWFPFPG